MIATAMTKTAMTTGDKSMLLTGDTRSFALFTIGTGSSLLLTASVLLGELIDRSEFYLHLDIITPPKQILLDLRKMIDKGNEM